jgi:hypothetical protein
LISWIAAYGSGLFSPSLQRASGCQTSTSSGHRPLHVLDVPVWVVVVILAGVLALIVAVMSHRR